MSFTWLQTAVDRLKLSPISPTSLVMNQLKKASRIINALTLALLRLLKVLFVAKLFCKHIYLQAWFGDLGNNLIQLANAEYLAAITGLDIRSPCHSFLRIEQQHTPHELVSFYSVEDTASPTYVWYLDHLQNKVKASNNLSKRDLIRYFYYNYDTLPFRPGLKDYRHLLKNRVLPLINAQVDPAITDETLVIHLRSGDIFGNASIHQAYVQPPLSFYLQIIETFDFKDIVIVTQKDFRNPCIHELKRLRPEVRIQAASLADDVNTLLSARNLVAGLSTFSIALGFASQQIKRLYVPQFELKQGYVRPLFWPAIFKLVLSHHSPKFDSETLDFQLYPVKILNYTAIGTWQNKREQRELMLSHPREQIEIFESNTNSI